MNHPIPPEQKKYTEAGFTLVELLIASSVFSVILLLLTFGMLQIGKVYYKGTTSSRTQAVARNISDEISQSIQFAGGAVTPLSVSGDTTTFCIGDKGYWFKLDKKLKDEPHVFVVDSSQCAVSFVGTPPQLKRSQRELMVQNTRLTRLIVNYDAARKGYGVVVRVAAGDNDMFEGDDPNNNCKGGAGGQFCAVSELYTFVQKRL
ncbi:MAG TPA: prepilin-type N-terminal cleavage/methylation domain-containing protein [Candidatus Saccharibacteria bacterium]|nr:prepilin-type N-terminal cleavage/methylation domain-containing protein [Candidatus Saccharibacteria bacterium]